MYIVLDTSGLVLDIHNRLNQSQPVPVQRIIVTLGRSGTARVDSNAIHGYGLLLA